jgi:phosphoserine phosphatase RsbU/P
MRAIRVLVVDDDEEDFLIARDLLADIAGEQRYEALWAPTREVALAHMLPTDSSEPDHDICLLDYRLGAISGVALLKCARERGYCQPTLLLTGSADRSIDQEALEVGASDYLVKGETSPEMLERSIRYAIRQKATEAELRATAQALSEARLREAYVGAAIQRTLLLRHGPSRHPDGFSLGVRILGAERVTGDYCDFLTFREQFFDVIIGDVMGKGMAAALVGAGVKSQLQRVVRRLTSELHAFGRLPEPQEIVGGLQEALTPTLNDLESFVTLSYARFVRNQNRLYYVDAGHPSILHWTAETQQVTFLRGDNVPLGMAADEFYEQKCTTFGPGDIFVLYSDGLVEARNSSGDEFGEERLHVALDPSKTPQEIADRLCMIVDEWRGGQGDDLTCVVVRIDPMGHIATPSHQLAKELRSHPDELETLRKLAEAFCESCGAQNQTDRVLLGLTEAAGNIIRHAYSHRHQEFFRFEASAQDESLSFYLHDRGMAFSPEAIPVPVLDDTAEGGFGWFLIQSCFDEATYTRDDLGWNHLFLKIVRSDN